MVKIRLFLVEEAQAYREGLAMVLESEPRIEVVGTCGMGLETIKVTHKYKPDVILVGVGSFESSSTDVIQRIHEELPGTSIIVLTSSETNEDLLSAVRAGVKAYLSETMSAKSINQTILLVAEDGVVIFPPMAARLLQEFSLLEEDKDATKSIVMLTKREQAVLSLVEQGFTNREIATTLIISENTVKVHLRNTMEKLHAHTRQQAVNMLKTYNQ